MTKNNQRPTSLISASLQRAKVAHLQQPDTELLAKGSEYSVEKTHEPPRSVLNELAPKLVNHSDGYPTIMKVMNSDIGEYHSKTVQIREPVSMIAQFDTATYKDLVKKHGAENVPMPSIVSEPDVTFDNINATLTALGLLFFKTFPAEVDVIQDWYGVRHDDMPEPANLRAGKWIYVPETRFKPSAKAERYQRAKEGAWVKEERTQRNRRYPERLIQLITDVTATRSDMESPEGRIAQLVTMQKPTVVLASVIIALRARAIWVARQYYKKYSMPLEISYEGVMNCLDNPEARIDILLGLDFKKR